MTQPPKTLAFRLLLAMASIVAYAVLVQLTPVFESVEGGPNMNTVFHLVVGAVFGAFVLAPCARAPRRVLRGFALAVAAAAIYYAAVRFVVNAPAGLDALATFVIAGAGAALLCGLAVAVIAPQPFGLRLAMLLLVAGAAGGAVFDVKFSIDPNLLFGHAAWQLLTCMALYFGLRSAST
jgi:hypothetical protein